MKGEGCEPSGMMGPFRMVFAHDRNKYPSSRFTIALMRVVYFRFDSGHPF